MSDVLIWGDTLRSPALRHEVPLAIGDPFLYVEQGGTRTAIVHALEAPLVEALGGDLEVRPMEELGLLELRAERPPRAELLDRFVLEACRRLGLRAATVPASFPLGLGDRLRADGVELRVDDELFVTRRRVKTAAQLAGIRRAQRAAEAAMRAAADLLRRARPAAGGLAVDGEPLTSDRLRAAMRTTVVRLDCSADDLIASHGPQSAIGHHPGEGRIQEGEPVVLDIWPRDAASGCHADMSRTFWVGEPAAEVRRWHALCREVLETTRAAARPGVPGSDLHAEACRFFEERGLPTSRSHPGTADGFAWSLGHGIGLEAHEAPAVGLLPAPPLVAGDVIAVEPGLARSDLGGLRHEDLLLVTEDGCETLTDFPYELPTT